MGRELQRVDELGVEARSHLDTHAAGEEKEVHHTEVALLPEGDLVLGYHASDDGVRGAGLGGLSGEDSHDAYRLAAFCLVKSVWK